jgi:hypothetical protein
VELQKAGVATVTVVTDAFLDLGREVAAALGAAGIGIAVVPHPLGELKREQVAERARRAFPSIMIALQTPGARTATTSPGTKPRVLALTGSWEEINTYFYAEGWTDGLPVVPPVRSRVEQFVAAAGPAADEVIGIVPPRMGIATVEKIAVNAVMAGCEPSHFPVVLAAVKAMCAPEFNLLPMQATTNPVTPLLIINGPIAQRLEVNGGCNVFGQGWKSNAAIGRAVRFVLVNIGGGAPGKLDHACHGQPGKYSFCIAENETANPWEPFHVERGYAASDSTVSVIGVAGTQDIIHYARTSADQVLNTLVQAIPRDGFKNLYSGGEPLLVFGPEQAAILAAGGLSKKDVKRAFFDRTRVPLDLLNPETISLLSGRRAKWFETGTPLSIPIADSEDHVQIIVAGGAGNHTAFLPTWGDTRCVTVRIEA